MSAPLSVTPVTIPVILSGSGKIDEESIFECWSDTGKDEDGEEEEIEKCWSDTSGIEIEVEDEQGDRNKVFESKEGDENDEIN